MEGMRQPGKMQVRYRLWTCCCWWVVGRRRVVPPELAPVSWTHGFGGHAVNPAAYSAGVRCPRPAWWRPRL